MLCSRREQRRLGPERPQLARRGLSGGVPGVVAGERQVLPAERRDVPHRIRADTEVGSGEFEVARVPEDDGRDDEVETRGAIGLVLEGAVAQLAELAEEDGAGERVPGLALVQACLRAPAQVEVAQPVQHEDRALEPAHLAQRDRQSVLARVGGQLLQHRRGGHGARADRRRHPQQLVPVLSDVHDVDLTAGVDHGREQRVDAQARRQVQPTVLEVAHARREAIAEEGHEPEDVVGGTACVDRVLVDRQPGLVVEQAVEHVRRLTGGRGDHLGVERTVLVGDVGVERDARLVAVTRVDVGDRLSRAAGEEVLPVGTRLGAVAPELRTAAARGARR